MEETLDRNRAELKLSKHHHSSNNSNISQTQPNHFQKSLECNLHFLSSCGSIWRIVLQMFRLTQFNYISVYTLHSRRANLHTCSLQELCLVYFEGLRRKLEFPRFISSRSKVLIINGETLLSLNFLPNFLIQLLTDIDTII